MPFILMLVGFVVVVTLAIVWLSLSLNRVNGKPPPSFSWRHGFRNKKNK